jgi:hypothetical protein
MPSLADIADAFTAIAAVVALLTVPYNLIALIYAEWNPKIRFVRSHGMAYYRPSLNYLTWLDGSMCFGVALLVANFFLRAYLHLDPESALQEQPPWSYILSMFNTTVLLLLFVLPSTMLFHIKRRILESPSVEISMDNRKLQKSENTDP